MIINRLVLSAALLGLVLVAHLWIQKERGFSGGCWGMAEIAPSLSSKEGCSRQELQQLRIAGIPIVLLGFIFYFSLAMTSLARTVASERVAPRLQELSEAISIVGFLCSGYLVYFQYKVVQSFCPLCLCSAAIATVVFVANMVGRMAAHEGVAAPKDKAQELGYALLTVFAGASGMLAVLLFVNNVGSLERGQARQAPAPFNATEWIEAIPPLRETEAGTELVAFLDPNCGHCPATYALLKKLSARYDHVRFFIVMRPLWAYSALQAQALEVAKAEKKYYPMWEAQFARKRSGGLGRSEVVGILDELGIGSGDKLARLEAVKQIVRDRTTKLQAAGINATPTLFLGGVAVPFEKTNEKGLIELLEKARASGAKREPLAR